MSFILSNTWPCPHPEIYGNLLLSYCNPWHNAQHLLGAMYTFGVYLILKVCKHILKHEETNKSHGELSLSGAWVPKHGCRHRCEALVNTWFSSSFLECSRVINVQVHAEHGRITNTLFILSKRCSNNSSVNAGVYSADAE